MPYSEAYWVAYWVANTITIHNSTIMSSSASKRHKREEVSMRPHPQYEHLYLTKTDARDGWNLYNDVTKAYTCVEIDSSDELLVRIDATTVRSLREMRKETWPENQPIVQPLPIVNDEHVHEIDTIKHRRRITSHGRFQALNEHNEWVDVELVSRRGYKRVTHQGKICLLHVLVDRFFNHSPEGGHVIHMDGNTLNNDAKNLKWIKKQRTVTRPRGTYSRSITIDGVYYPSRKAASEALGITYQTVYYRLKSGMEGYEEEESSE